MRFPGLMSGVPDRKICCTVFFAANLRLLPDSRLRRRHLSYEEAMPKTAFILSFMLLVTVAALAQNQEPSPNSATPQALRGCLSSTPPGGYELADDETGAVYNLVGNPEGLRMLVGNDVLITGQALGIQESESEKEDDPAGSGLQPKGRVFTEAERRSSNKIGGGNSFRVVSTIKVSDLCILSAGRQIAHMARPNP